MTLTRPTRDEASSLVGNFKLTHAYSSRSERLALHEIGGSNDAERIAAVSKVQQAGKATAGRSSAVCR